MDHFFNQHQGPVFFKGREYSRHQLLEMARKLAHYAHQQGISTLAFCNKNSPVSLIAYLAAWLGSIHALPINPRLKSHELKQILCKVKPQALIIEHDRIDRLLSSVCQQQSIALLGLETDPMQGELWQAIDPVEPLSQDRPITPTALTYHLTSGTQGQYKVVVHDLEQILSYAKNRSHDMGYHPQDKLLIALSLNHAFAFSYQFLPAWQLGLAMSIEPEFDASSVLQAIDQQGIYSIALLPSMTYALAKHPYPFSQAHKLRYALTAGDALPKAMQDAFRARFDTPLYQGIGMTEVFGYAQNTPQDFNPLATGKLFASTQLEIRNDDGAVLPQGQTGHVFIRNEATPLRYLHEEALTQSELNGGWVNTGDIGRLDNDGHFYFLGRKKQIIIQDGSNIAPLEIENALYQHPHILQAAVVGKQHPIHGQVVVAYVVSLDPNLDASTLKAHLRPYLADYKIPQSIHFETALPLNATGKIDRLALEANAKASSSMA